MPFFWHSTNRCTGGNNKKTVNKQGIGFLDANHHVSRFLSRFLTTVTSHKSWFLVSSGLASTGRCGYRGYLGLKASHGEYLKNWFSFRDHSKSYSNHPTLWSDRSLKGPRTLVLENYDDCCRLDPLTLDVALPANSNRGGILVSTHYK